MLRSMQNKVAEFEKNRYCSTIHYSAQNSGYSSTISLLS